MIQRQTDIQYNPGSQAGKTLQESIRNRAAHRVSINQLDARLTFRCLAQNKCGHAGQSIRVPGPAQVPPPPDPEDPGGGGPIPDPGGEDPEPPRLPRPGQWPFRIDCAPRYRALRPRIGSSCSGWEPVILAAHEQAYRMALTALRTAEYIHNQESQTRGLLWNWGTATKEPWSQYSPLWGGSTTARYSSPAYWFGGGAGPYIGSGATGKLAHLFREVVKWFEEGAVAHIAGNWNGARKPVKYWCSWLDLGIVARHPTQRQIELGRWFTIEAVNDPNVARMRASIILHECMHNILGLGKPRDEKAKGVCTHSWLPGEEGPRCYSNFFDHYSWHFGETPSDPRRLVLAHRDETANNNIDNFVSWAVRRWMDPQFGQCDGPRPPGPIEGA